MTHTSKSLSMLMTSSSLLACLSNPLFAMNHLKDDVNPGCCNNVKKAAVQYGAKKLEDYALAKVRALAKTKLNEEVKKKLDPIVGNAWDVSVVGLPIQKITDTMIDYLGGKTGSQLEGMRKGKSLFTPAVRVALKESIDEVLLPQVQILKPLIKPAIETYAEKALNYTSAATYIGLSGLIPFMINK